MICQSNATALGS